MLTLAQFQNTRQHVADVGAAVGFDDGEGARPGFVYADSCYIEERPADPFHPLHNLTDKLYLLTVEREQWSSDDIGELERILWATFYVFNSEDNELDQDESLKDFVKCHCEAWKIEVDPLDIDALFSIWDEKIAPRDAADVIEMAASMNADRKAGRMPV